MSKITLSSAIDEYLSAIHQKKAKSTHTISAQSSDLKHILRYFDDTLLTNITDGSIRNFFGELVNQRRYAYTTINRFWSTTVSFFNFCFEKNYIHINPLSGMKPPVKAEIHPPTVLTKTEIRRLLQAPVKEQKRLKKELERRQKEDASTKRLERILFDSVRNRAVLELLFATGIRVSELVNLTEKDFNFHNYTVTIKDHKGEKRIGYFPSGDVRDALQKYMSLTDRRSKELQRGISGNEKNRESRVKSECFFRFRKGKPLGLETVRNIVHRYAQTAGIKKTVTPYTLRHTLASFLLAAKVNIHSVQRLLGTTDSARILLTAKKK